jgi:hypothetical protein
VVSRRSVHRRPRRDRPPPRSLVAGGTTRPTAAPCPR